MSDEIAAAVKQAQILEKALQKATTDKGLSFRSLNSELQKAGTTASEMVATLAAAGPAFAGSLDSFLGAFATADRNLISISRKIKELQRVMTQSIKFTAAAQIQQFVYGQIQEAISWVKELNSELNTIAIVSGKSAEAMNAVYESVIRNSKELRVAADDYAYAAQIFYQQGLGDDEVERRAQITIKAAQAAGQSTQEMSQQLTAVWNTYKMQGEELERAASVGARMGAETAVEFKDIATAMQISASAAAQMGVEYDMLASIIATVGDTTQQSASVIGNAYKTIFSRFDQLVSSGTDGEVTLGRVSQQLSNLGVKILDESGELVNLGDTIMDLGNRWEEYSQKQQIALAEAIGGTRQFGQVLALFNNWDKFMANYQSAQSEMGSETLEAQYLTSLDSIESAAINAGEAWNRAFSNIFQEDTLKGFYNGLEEVGSILEGVLEGFGGLPGILALIGAYMSRHLLTGVQKISQEWKTFQDNLTPQRQLAAANAELDKMSAKVKDIHFNGVGTKTTSPEYQNAVSNNEYDQQKLNITREVTQATIKLNDIEKTATQETKNKVQYLREALTLSQQNANQAINNLKTERESAKNQEVIIQAMQRRVAYLKQMAANTIEGSDNYAKEAEDLENLTNLTQDLNNVRKATNDLSPNGIKDFSAAIGSMANSVKNIKGLEGFSDQLMALQKSVGKGSGTIVDSFGDFNAILDDMIISIDGNDAASKRMRQTLQTYQSQLQATIQYQQQLRNALADTSNFAGQIDAAFKLSGTSLQAFNQSLMNSISSVSMLALQFSALWRTIESGDASFGAIALQLGLLAPSLISTGKMVKELIKSFVAAMTKLGAQKIGTEQYTAANDRLTKAIERQRRAQEKLNAARAAGNSKRSLGQLQRRVNEAEAEVKSAEAEVKATAPSKGKAMGAGMLETAKNAGSKILGVLRAIPPQAYIAAAAIAAIVLIYNEWEKTTAEAKMERMAKAAQGLKEQADEAQQTADNLRTTIESYDSAVDTLNNCVRGTEEWNEALKKVNESALEVVNSLDFMALSAEEIDDLYSYQDGMLTFNEDLLDKAQQSADAEAARAQYAASMAQADLANQQRMVNTKTDIRAIKRNSELGIAGGAAAGAGIGALVGSIVPVVGNAIGAAVGAGIGAIAGGIAGNNIGMNVEAENAMQALYDNIDKLSNKTGTELVQELTKLGFSSTEVSQNLDKYTQIVAEVSAATQAYEAQIRAATAASVETQLGDEYDATTKAAVTEQVIATQDTIEEDLSKWIDDSFNKADIFNAAGAEDSLLSRYNAAAGTNYTADGNFSRGTDNNRTFAFKDETGELIELTKEQVVSTIAASEALQDLGTTADETAKMLARLDAGSEAATDAIRDFITNRNLDTATKGEYEQIEQGVEESGSAKQYLIDIGFNEDLAEQYASQLEQSLEIDWEGTVAKFKDTLNNIDSLSVGAAKNIQETFDKISYGPDGEEAAQSFIDGINNLYSQVDLAKIMRENDMNMEEAKEYVMNALGNIDWDSYDVDQQIVTTMRELGVEVDTTTEEYKQFIAELRHSTQAMPDFSSLISQLKEISTITKDLEFGTIISEEDYNNLVNMNAELAKYFMLTAEGYKMIGEGNLVQEAGIQKLEEEIALMRERADWAEDFQADTNWVLNDSEGNKIEDFNWNAYAEEGSQYANSSTLTNFMNNEASMELAENLGWTKEEIQAIKDGLDAGGEAAVEAEAKLKSFAGAIANVQTAGADQIQLEEMLASTAESFGELESMLKEKRIGVEAFSKGFQALDESMDMRGLDTEEVEDFADHLMEVNENLEDNPKAARDTAKGIMQMNDAIEDLNENGEEWFDVLENSTEGSEEYSKAMGGLKESLSLLLGVEEDAVSSDFVVQNLDDIKLAAEGDVEAINRLQIAFAKDFVAKLEIDDSQLDTFNTAWNTVLSQMGDIDVGVTLDGQSEFVQALNTMIEASGMTATQVNTLLGGMGFETNFAEEDQEVKQTRKVTQTTTVETGKTSGSYTRTDPLSGEPVTEYWEYPILQTSTEEVDADEVWETVPTFAMTTDGTSPKIESVTRTRDASASDYSPQNSGGKTLGNTGGGGGGSKFKPQERVTDQEKVHKRYENLTEALEDMTRQLDRFSNAADDAWGAARIRQLRGYNAQIQQIAKTQKQLIEETKEYYKLDKNTLMADANIASMALWNPGEYGSLANPEDIRRWIDEEIEAATAGINAEIDAYNTRGVDDQDALDAAKKPYEERIEYLEGLNEDLDQMLETTDLLQDRLDEQMQNIYDWMANKVEEMEYKLEFKLRIDESDFDRLENLLDRLGDTGIILGDSFETLSDMMSNIMTEQAPAVFEAIDRGWQIANNIVTPENQDYFEGLFGPEVWQEYLDNNGGLPAEIMEFLQDQKDALYDMIDQVVDLALEQLDGIFTKMEQWFEKYARLTDQLDVAVTRMDTLQEILDFKGTNYSTQGGRQVQRRLNEERMNAAGTQAKIAKSQLEQAKQWAAEVEAEYNTMKEAYDNASDEEKSALAGGVNELYQEMIAAQEQVIDFEGEFAESISEIFSTAQEVLEQEREMAKANISATIGGLFSDIDEMMNMYSAVDSWSNMHLDDYDKNYLLGDLQSQFDEATENINVDSYEGLAQWQEQLNKYKEDGRNVTQEEVDLLQKALDLEIARANFEDAQNAKNTMRLARDASGNWSYIYSQDQTSSGQADEIARLEYEYKKAYEEMQDSFGENIMDMAAQMTSVIDGINYQLYFSSEQYRKMIDTQLDMLSQQMIASGATIEQVTSIMGTGIKNWQYDFSQSAAGIVTDTQSMEEMIDKFLVALVGTSEGYIPGNTSSGGFYGDWMTAQKDVAQVVNEKGDEIGEKFGLIQEDIGGYIDEIVTGEQGSLHYLKIETQTTQEFMDTYLGYMEDDWSDTENYLMGQIGEKGDTQQGTITGDIHQIDQAAEEMRNDTLGEFDGLLTGLQNWGINFRSEVQTWIDKLNEYIKKIKEAEIASEKKMDDDNYVNEEAEKVETQKPAEPAAPSTPATEPSGSKAVSKGDVYIGAKFRYIGGKYYHDSYGTKPLGSRGPGGIVTVENVAWGRPYEIAVKSSNSAYGWLNLDQLEKLKSGGYTGDWGPEGKLAMLHEKELVLNKQDTENILNTVKLMREAVAQKIAALNNRNISGAELKSFADKAQTIEQQVHIEASFPNVSVAAEIEQAFNDLINQVAQYNIKK